jgi:hypothetical protein
VAIGLAASASAASAAAPATASGMPAAHHNPVYEAHTEGGVNTLHG